MIPPRSNTRTWIRKVDGSMHVVGPDEQPHWYPGNLSELLHITTKEPSKPPAARPEAKVCGSHWAMSKAAVTHGQMVEMATPVHEWDGDQAAPRLNKPLYEVIPGCMSQAALDAFMRQDVKAFDATVLPEMNKFYLFSRRSGHAHLRTLLLHGQR